MAKKLKTKKKAAKPSTALAVRPKVASVSISGLPAQAPVGQLGELSTVGSLGLVELKLTPDEEKVLSEPVNPADIRWKPRVKDGPPEIPYLPHPVYTKWFCRAFGRTGWALVPTQRPQRVENLMLREFVLYVHGVPVASAIGEQEYYPTNKQQTYGDVIESLYASALRRTAKHLNVGLEMWDKEYLDRLPRPRGVRHVQREEFIDAESVREPAPAPKMDDQTPLTKAQWDRLHQIAEKAGRDAADVGMWLRKRYRLTDLKQLPRSVYHEVCRFLEARGVLPMPGDGQ